MKNKLSEMFFLLIGIYIRINRKVGLNGLLFLFLKQQKCLECLFMCLFLYNELQKQQKYKKRDKKEQKNIDNDFI